MFPAPGRVWLRSLGSWTLSVVAFPRVIRTVGPADPRARRQPPIDTSMPLTTNEPSIRSSPANRRRLLSVRQVSTRVNNQRRTVRYNGDRPQARAVSCECFRLACSSWRSASVFGEQLICQGGSFLNRVHQNGIRLRNTGERNVLSSGGNSLDRRSGPPDNMRECFSTGSAPGFGIGSASHIISSAPSAGTMSRALLQASRY